MCVTLSCDSYKLFIIFLCIWSKSLNFFQSISSSKISNLWVSLTELIIPVFLIDLFRVSCALACQPRGWRPAQTDLSPIHQIVRSNLLVCLDLLEALQIVKDISGKLVFLHTVPKLVLSQIIPNDTKQSEVCGPIKQDRSLTTPLLPPGLNATSKLCCWVLKRGRGRVHYGEIWRCRGAWGHAAAPQQSPVRGSLVTTGELYNWPKLGFPPSRVSRLDQTPEELFPWKGFLTSLVKTSLRR